MAMATAGSIVATYQTKQDRQTVKQVALAWTSDSSGNVEGIPTFGVLSGVVLQFAVLVPGTGGSRPKNGYIVRVLLDGFDALGGKGTGSDTAAVNIKSVWPVNSSLTLNITGASAKKSGTVLLYFR